MYVVQGVSVRKVTVYGAVKTNGYKTRYRILRIQIFTDPNTYNGRGTTVDFYSKFVQQQFRLYFPM